MLEEARRKPPRRSIADRRSALISKLPSNSAARAKKFTDFDATSSQIDDGACAFSGVSM